MGPGAVDSVTANLVKCAKTEFLYPLTFIFNLSIDCRTFPFAWKIATVAPLFKSGDSSDADNYRPISVLPTFGKLLEWVIYNQCTTYLSENNLLTDAQSGFREGHSTATCLTSFLNDIIVEADAGGGCGVLFLDLTKAFDTVNHIILEQKLQYPGFKRCAINWFASIYVIVCK